MQLMPKPMTNRERDRHIQEAEDGITTCEAAFEKLCPTSLGAMSMAGSSSCGDEDWQI